MNTEEKKKSFEIGQSVKCVNTKPLGYNTIAPDLVHGDVYPVKGIVLDSAGNQHLDVGLVSNLNWVKSIETGEELPDGDRIHWCHPSRFEHVDA